jgi:hypothetical protein
MQLPGYTFKIHSIVKGRGRASTILGRESRFSRPFFSTYMATWKPICLAMQPLTCLSNIRNQRRQSRTNELICQVHISYRAKLNNEVCKSFPGMNWIACLSDSRNCKDTQCSCQRIAIMQVSSIKLFSEVITHQYGASVHRCCINASHNA